MRGAAPAGENQEATHAAIRLSHSHVLRGCLSLTSRRSARHSRLWLAATERLYQVSQDQLLARRLLQFPP